MQRLPPLNIEGTKEAGKVLREKYPGATHLGAGNLTGGNRSIEELNQLIHHEGAGFSSQIGGSLGRSLRR